MRNFTWGCSTKFVFGKDVVAEIGEQASQLGYKRALIVCGGESARRSGVLGCVEGSLTAAGIECKQLAGVRPNPEVNQVRMGVALAKSFDADVIVAVGGGSVIDCAKAISFGALYEADVWDFFARKEVITKVLPLLCVLTIPAAGSESSSSCVISNDELGLKRGVTSDLFRPVISFMDPQLTFTLPPYQTAAGATDMIAHLCERWFSGVEAVPVTDRTNAGLIRTIMESATACLADPEDYDARANLMWAGTLAHNGIAGVGRSLKPEGRAGGWESHALEHELSAFDPAITHGAGLAVMMPAWMRYVYMHDAQRFADFGEQVFDIRAQGTEEAEIERAALASIDALVTFFASIGMPSKLGEFGLKPENVDSLLVTLEQNKGAQFGAFTKLNMEDARAIYLSAF